MGEVKMSAVLDPPRHRFSRAQYELMVESGIFGPEDRLELLEGEIIDMAPQKSRHATAVTLLTDALKPVFATDHTVRAQLPFSLNNHSQPEPDIAVVPGAPRDYRDAHPTRALLIVEVADTTLAYDRGRKLAAYARAGIPEFWILDLNGETLEICSRPEQGGYAQRQVLARGEQVIPGAGNGAAVTVEALLP